MRFRPVYYRILALCVMMLIFGSLARASGATYTVCIDPGHPSEVGRGTSGRHISEMEVAWLVANRLQAILQKDGINVVMTKSREDQYVTNIDRASVANAANANLMVRLHCDGGNGIGSGFAVYYPDHRGHAHGRTGPSLAVIAESGVEAKAFYAEMVRSLKGQIGGRGLHSDSATRIGGIRGALTGSIFAKEPVVLVEMCVLTNPSDEDWIRSPQGQQKMAEALAAATLIALAAKTN